MEDIVISTNLFNSQIVNLFLRQFDYKQIRKNNNILFKIYIDDSGFAYYNSI